MVDIDLCLQVVSQTFYWKLHKNFLKVKLFRSKCGRYYLLIIKSYKNAFGLIPVLIQLHSMPSFTHTSIYDSYQEHKNIFERHTSSKHFHVLIEKYCILFGPDLT